MPHAACVDFLDDLDALIAEYEAADARARFSANQNLPEPAQALQPQAIAPSAAVSTPVGVSTPSYTPLPSPSRKLSLSRPCAPVRLHVPANQNVRAWDRLTESDKLQPIGQAAVNAGAISFTCQTNPRKEASLRHSAAAGKDVRQIIADEIARQCRKRGLKVPPLLFLVEEAPENDHVHTQGFLVPDDHSPEYFAKLREAFIAAHGKRKGQSCSSQFWRNGALYTPARWIAYSSKAQRRVKRSLNLDSVIYVSNSMRRLGRAHHESTRKPAPAPAIPATKNARPTIAPATPHNRPERVTSARRVVSAVLHRPAPQTHCHRVPGRSRVIPPRSTSPPFEAKDKQRVSQL